MTMSPDMRAGDQDRDRTVGLLREAFAEGRLTNDEFQDSAVAVPGGKKDWRKAFASWLGVAVIVNAIWAATWISHPSDVPYYWPIWVMLPWGAVLLIGFLSDRGGRS